MEETRNAYNIFIKNFKGEWGNVYISKMRVSVD
jgi:hypothetical protein